MVLRRQNKKSELDKNAFKERVGVTLGNRRQFTLQLLVDGHLLT